MLIVADSSALIALATCQGLDILLQLYDDFKVPQAVYDETVIQAKPLSTRLAEFLSNRVQKVEIAHWVLAAGDLGRGELEAMALYKQLNAHKLLIDDRRARLIAEYNGIQCIGVLGLLLNAKQQGVIEKIAPYIEALRLSSIYYADPLLDKVLALAGE